MTEKGDLGETKGVFAMKRHDFCLNGV